MNSFGLSNQTQTTLFYNRLVKRYKHLKKYARRLGIFAYRLYDKDIPEISVAVDLYIEDKTDLIFAVLTEYERSPRNKEGKTTASLSELTEALCTALQIPSEQVYEKCRRRQRGEAQYEKIADSGKRIIVREGKCRFFVNISDYLDTGLFLDHRPTRLVVAESAAGKTVLNLFCYTASFSVHALVNGARRVCSVDLSKNYLQWAHENVQLNGVADPDRCQFVQNDVRLFLEQAAKRKERWDVIICDPPTFSNSKRTPQFFDVNRHWQDLIRSCCQVLSAEGVLYFSTNSRTLRFSTAELSDRPAAGMGADKFVYQNTLFTVQDISTQSIPEDFRNKKIHRLWKIRRSTTFSFENMRASTSLLHKN